MGLRSISILLAAAICLSGCAQSVDLPTAPEFSEDEQQDLFTSDAPSFDVPATSSATSSPELPASASTTPHVGSVLPNNFNRLIGQGYFQRWLNSPAGLATIGDFVLVADGNRKDLLGSHGAILEFDGKASNAATPLSDMFTTLKRGLLPSRLSPRLKALAANQDTLVTMDDRGVYGFVHDTRAPLNLGNALTDAGQAIALSASTLYVAQADRVLQLSSRTFAPDAASPSLAVAAQGLAVDREGKLFVATATQIVSYEQGAMALKFDGKGTDGTGPGFEALVGLAIDPRNDDLYALDRHAVLRFDAQGRYLCRFAQERLGQGGSIAVGASGEVYVADSQNKQVLQFEAGR